MTPDSFPVSAMDRRYPQRVSAQRQLELFAHPPPSSFLPLTVALCDPERPIFILPCGRRKAGWPAEARKLYVSPRFSALRRLAEAAKVEYYIASAKHGLLEPDQVVSPYDRALETLTEPAQASWANSVLQRLEDAAHRPIVLLLSGRYLDAVLEANGRRAVPLRLYAPLAGQTEGAEEEWARRAASVVARIRDAERLYRAIYRKKPSQNFLLRDLGEISLPKQGVYIFLDDSERSLVGHGPRIVRIGTHAVSEGSKASLRNRLRNHFGKEDGLGSHRGSVFRLHVGRAMLEAAGGHGSLPTWGAGQHATREVVAAEAALEREVSQYVGNLRLFVIPIEDNASKNSRRALVERQLIALLTEDMIPIDPPSNHWLGAWSPTPPIAEMGLWNIREVGGTYDPHSPGVVDHILNRVVDA
jgi:hypothetical protein